MTPALPPDHAERMARARLALDGLSVGDAFGQHFFSVPNVEFLIGQRAVPFPRWHYTDDTEMALAILAVLERFGQMNQDALALEFDRRYRARPGRGYGRTALVILEAIRKGAHWSEAASDAFDGKGSMGNGAAMRVAPLGGYFADSIQRVVAEARASAAVTHFHPEGQAGAIAVAVAATYAWRVGSGEKHAPGRLLETALAFTPASETRMGMEKARELPPATDIPTVAGILGSGQRVTAPDTVPFTLWCADRCLLNYEEAIWSTVAGLGDRDTTCAIVGGIVALAAGRSSIPPKWLTAREPLSFDE